MNLLIYIRERHFSPGAVEGLRPVVVEGGRQLLYYYRVWQ